MSDQKHCPNCGAANSAENMFCQACGTRLGGAQASTPPGGAAGGQPSQYQGYAPQGGYQPGGPGYPPQGYYPGAGAGYTENIRKLGTRLDGWADVVRDAAEKSEELIETFDEAVRECGMPQVRVLRQSIGAGGLSTGRRSYHLSRSDVGASVAVYIGRFGKDLYLTWDLFVRPVIMWRYMAVMAIIAAVLAAPGGAFLGFSSAILGEDLFSGAFFTLGCWFFSALIWLVIIAIGAVVVGKLFWNNPLLFFIKEIDHFSADDVAAMTMVVHKTLMECIDSVGLDSALVRRKERFSGGQRERLI